MSILLISLFALGIFAFLLNKFQKDDEIKEDIHENSNAASCKESEYCCGAHEVCEEGKKKKEQVPFDYYEDEELDRFRSRSSDTYTSEEIQEFQEVLETLQINEINGWLKSLNIRGIHFPKGLIGLLSSRLQERKTAK